MRVKRSNGRIEECYFAGLHSVLCNPAIDSGVCRGGCTDFILLKASQRSGSEIASAILGRRPASFLQFKSHK
jgi:hypothetical protein